MYNNKEIVELLNQISHNQNLILNQYTNPSKPMTVKDVAEYLSLAKNTIYSYTNSKSIPFHKPIEGKLYFLKEEIDNWIINNSEDQNNRLVINNIVNFVALKKLSEYVAKQGYSIVDVVFHSIISNIKFAKKYYKCQININANAHIENNIKPCELHIEYNTEENGKKVDTIYLEMYYDCIELEEIEVMALNTIKKFEDEMSFKADYN